MQIDTATYMHRNGNAFYSIWSMTEFSEDVIFQPTHHRIRFSMLDIMYIELLCCGPSGFKLKNKERDK